MVCFDSINATSSCLRHKLLQSNNFKSHGTRVSVGSLIDGVTCAVTYTWNTAQIEVSTSASSRNHFSSQSYEWRCWSVACRTLVALHANSARFNLHSRFNGWLFGRRPSDVRYSPYRL